MEIMEIPPAREGSRDNFLHFIDNDCIDNNGKNKLVIFSKDIDNIQNLIIKKEGDTVTTTIIMIKMMAIMKIKVKEQ